MLRLKWHFRNDKRDITINTFKTKSTFNPRNENAAIEIYLSSLKEKLSKLEVRKDNLITLLFFRYNVNITADDHFWNYMSGTKMYNLRKFQENSIAK